MMMIYDICGHHLKELQNHNFDGDETFDVIHNTGVDIEHFLDHKVQSVHNLLLPPQEKNLSFL